MQRPIFEFHGWNSVLVRGHAFICLRANKQETQWANTVGLMLCTAYDLLNIRTGKPCASVSIARVFILRYSHIAPKISSSSMRSFFAREVESTEWEFSTVKKRREEKKFRSKSIEALSIPWVLQTGPLHGECLLLEILALRLYQRWDCRRFGS